MVNKNDLEGLASKNDLRELVTKKEAKNFATKKGLDAIETNLLEEIRSNNRTKIKILEKLHPQLTA